MHSDASKTRRVELILRQIESIPTLPSVATRLLAATADDESDAREVIDLVRSDQALTARVLAMCQAADKGVRREVMTIDRAVLLLGFNAIRNAVLSIKVFERFGPAGSDDDEQGVDPSDDSGFDRVNFFRHCLAVGVAAELIAEAHPEHGELDPPTAFVCGLLHDIGKIALDQVLPRSFARVLELADLNQGNIAEFERRIVGLDHHTAGKRLAEQWRFPHALQDSIWLHGTPYDLLPNLDHKRLVGLVSLADMLVRQQHIGYSGNFTFTQNTTTLAEKIGLDPVTLDSVTHSLHEQLAERAQMLGLDDQPSREHYLRSIQNANLALGRLNDALERRSRTAAKQTEVLEAVCAFHETASPGQAVGDVIDAVAASAAKVLGAGFYGALYQPDPGDDTQSPWLVCHYSKEGRPLRRQYIDPPPHSPSLARVDAEQPLSMDLMGLLPWIADYLIDAPDLREVRLLPLTCPWGTVAVLLHDRSSMPPWLQLSALTSTWGATIAAAAQHDGARRLGEELAEANRALAEAQDRLLQHESLAKLGEMAAGAAHEMNNPLAVISGRAQLLTMTLAHQTKEHAAAQTIFEQSHRLSDLITALRLFADPPHPDPRPVDIGALLQSTVDRIRKKWANKRDCPPILLRIKGELPAVHLDPEQVSDAVGEILINAIQASPRGSVEVSARIDEEDQELSIQVVDDGIGMDEHVLSHATDPFFSAKAAGRRVGMGLTRAQQWIHGHGGRIELRSTPGEGTTATIHMPASQPQAGAMQGAA